MRGRALRGMLFTVAFAALVAAGCAAAPPPRTRVFATKLDLWTPKKTSEPPAGDRVRETHRGGVTELEKD